MTKSTLLYGILFILAHLVASAQCDPKITKTPCFTTTDTIGCIPYTVNLSDCSGACVPRYIFFEGIRSRIPTYTYTSIGVFDVIQELGTDEIESSDPIRIRAVSDTKPKFKVNYCKDRIVKLTFSKENLYDKFIINYGDGSTSDTVKSTDIAEKQYLDDEEKTINVKGVYNHAPCTNTSTANVFPQKTLDLPTIKTVTTTHLSDTTGSIAITLSASSFFGYQLYLSKNNNPFQLIDSVTVANGDTTLLLDSLNTLENSYCFYFSTYDFCGNTKLSDTLCSISTFATPINNQNNIQWTKYPLETTISTYQIFKNNIELPFNRLDTTYVDSIVVCGNNYCYTIQTNPSSASNTTIISNSFCVASISTDIPFPITDLQSSVVSTELVALNWTSPTPYRVFSSRIEYANDKSNFLPLATTTNFDSSYTHPLAINSSACYIINYTDFCGNNSDISKADTSCTIYLQATKIQDTEYDLSWTPYLGFTTNSYLLQYLDDKGNVALEKNSGNVVSYKDETPLELFQNLRYRIKATETSGKFSYSNIVEFELKPRIFMPNAFSPDGDGINDYFKPDTRFIESYSLSIFDRWGELIFQEQNSTNGWNGIYKGKTVPTGTYVYLLKGIDYYGNSIDKKGTVTVYY